jgi:Flp pilus assembly pilin Flp
VIRFFIDFWKDDQHPSAERPEKAAEEPRRRSESGQALVEYCILLTWTCLAMMAMINAAGGGTNKVWTTANSDLSRANTTAS